MPGTKEGARKAVAAILARDPDHFRKMGAKGGKNGSTGGFAHMAAHDPERHRSVSVKGGTIGGKVSRKNRT